ncbi:MAG: hypothetical protein DWP97_08285 [Calditrichaeota bacterium]|nr:MAG: hypothetical protein DWP97_08285 [Calditrichota bacterium]
MTDKTRQKVIAVSMVASLIWAGANYNSDKKNDIPVEKAKTIQPLDASKVNRLQKNLSKNIIDEYSNKSWGRSPFVSTYSVTKSGTTAFTSESIGWNLSGIIFNKTSPVAVINKRPVMVGQTVDRAEVIAIEKNEVIIKIDDKQIKLNVSKG